MSRSGHRHQRFRCQQGFPCRRRPVSLGIVSVPQDSDRCGPRPFVLLLRLRRAAGRTIRPPIAEGADPAGIANLSRSGGRASRTGLVTAPPRSLPVRPAPAPGLPVSRSAATASPQPTASPRPAALPQLRECRSGAVPCQGVSRGLFPVGTPSPGLSAPASTRSPPAGPPPRSGRPSRVAAAPIAQGSRSLGGTCPPVKAS